MSLENYEMLSAGVKEVYDEIGIPMTYLPLDRTVKPDKFGNLTPAYDVTKKFTFMGFLNLEDRPDADVKVVTAREDGGVAIVTQDLVTHNIVPLAKDAIEIIDVWGNTQRYVVTGLAKTPGSTNIGLPNIVTYLDVALDSSISKE